MTSQKEMSIGFAGGGYMAQAIIRGLLQAGHNPNKICVADPSAEQRDAVNCIEKRVVTTADNSRLAAGSDVLVLAVKPQIIPEVAQELGNQQRALRQVVVSIAAGITLATLEKCLGAGTQIVRVMPNQPALAGQGISGLCANEPTDELGRSAAEYLITATGQAVWVADENLMDAVTAVSGSGPAYFYLLMEILHDVAMEFGFDTETARKLSIQTALGAATVAAQSADELAVLRERVTSPGGTTAAALESLDKAGIHDIFRKAVNAARERSIELGKVGKDAPA